VVRAVEEEKAAQAAGGGEAAGAVFVFQASGKLLHAVKGARAYSLAAGQAGAAVALVAETEAAGAKYSTVTLVGKELRQALRVRGRFLLETMEGPVEPGAAAGGAPAAGAQGAPELPVFRYDAAARACRGPAGGPDKAWEVDRSASPGYSP
jgi:hypothetical protein